MIDFEEFWEIFLQNHKNKQNNYFINKNFHFFNDCFVGGKNATKHHHNSQ